MFSIGAFVLRLLPYLAEVRRHGLDRVPLIDFIELFAGASVVVPCAAARDLPKH